MAVGDVLRLQTWIRAETVHYSFVLHYLETETPSSGHPAQALVDGWITGIFPLFFETITDETELSVQRAWRVLPKRGIPGQVVYKAQFGVELPAEGPSEFAARFLVPSTDPTRSRANYFDLAGLAYTAAKGNVFSPLITLPALRAWAAELSGGVNPLTGGAWSLAHMSKAIPNGVNSYGSPSLAGDVVVLPTPRLPSGRAMPRLGASANLPP